MSDQQTQTDLPAASPQMLSYLWAVANQGLSFIASGETSFQDLMTLISAQMRARGRNRGLSIPASLLGEPKNFVSIMNSPERMALQKAAEEDIWAAITSRGLTWQEISRVITWIKMRLERCPVVPIETPPGQALVDAFAPFCKDKE